MFAHYFLTFSVSFFYFLSPLLVYCQFWVFLESLVCSIFLLSLSRLWISSLLISNSCRSLSTLVYQGPLLFLFRKYVTVRILNINYIRHCKYFTNTVSSYSRIHFWEPQRRLQRERDKPRKMCTKGWCTIEHKYGMRTMKITLVEEQDFF